MTLALRGGLVAAARVGGVSEDTVVNIENIVGGSAADLLTGDALANRLSGGAGADVLDGRAGVDVADYRDKTGALLVSLNGGIDSIVTVGGVAEDTLRGIETVYGGSGADTLRGDGEANYLHGGEGGDVLKGGRGRDVLDGGLGLDIADYRDKTTAVAVTLNGASNAGVTVGGVAEDTLRSIESVFGGTAVDTLTGDGLANTFRGGEGADVLRGGAGADLFVYAALSDSTVAVAGRDSLTDFAPGDRIDLRLLDANTTAAGDQAFVLGALAAGQAGRLAVTGGAGQWLVEGDVTGDGVADFAITVTSAAAPGAADFRL